jgi:hypothetical protein|tara:strand:- start:643 stop:1047 length:405 start_codon:yes stop_codon:yes gene_type:complete
MAITYTNKGSATTTAITNAPSEVQTFWKLCDDENVSIARVRKLKDRYEYTSGDTFNTTHVGKVSLNVLKKHPQRNVRFYQKVGIGKRNPMMQVLEVPENFRITDEYLDAFKTLRLNRDFEQPTLFQRMNKALFG